MIKGIGIDQVQIDRIRTVSPRLFERICTPAEREYCEKFGEGRFERYAGRFAAKEAFGKALGTGVEGFALRDVEVVNDPRGKPELRLHGNAPRALAAFGGRRVHVSLSHEDDNAIAMVVIED